MHYTNDSLQLSASDLAGHLNCRYLTELDLAVAKGERAKPKVDDPSLEILVERGRRHETAYVEHLRSKGHSIEEIDRPVFDDAASSKTTSAMKAGFDVIVQGSLQEDGWIGTADILRRVAKPSDLGDWSYEVADTKLARTTKGGSVLQLSLYSELLSARQGVTPELAYIVAPGRDYEPEEFRTSDFAAYYRRVKKSLRLATSEVSSGSIYPDPNEHCEICRWLPTCNAIRRADDHLCLVANISKMQINELKRRGITTLSSLASQPLPLTWKPDRGSVAAYERVREQARIQVEGRNAGRVLYESLPIVAEFGLSRLPEPSTGDIFFDLEGDPFVDGGGMEFLFGYAFVGADEARSYTAEWVLTREDEKRAFETFVDFVVSRLTVYPDLHIYHYAPYEPSAIKRLMGRYATREVEIDMLLRSQRFVDLYSVVRNGIRASVERYSIKDLEPLYEFGRTMALFDAGRSLIRVQACLELGDTTEISDADRKIVQGYNRDDCLSNWQLRDWLESLRTELIGKGHSIERPEQQTGDASENVTAHQERINALIDILAADIPADVESRTPQQQGSWLLAYILDWHRREKKAVWWELFRLTDLSSEDLLDERAGLSGLSLIGSVDGTGKLPTHRYSFPPQESELRDGAELRAQGGAKLGTIQAISLEERTVDIKKRKDTVDVHSEAVFEFSDVNTDVLAQSLLRIGDYVAEHGITGDGSYQIARDLLMREQPRIDGEPLRIPGENPVASATRIAPHLNGGVLPIQGPPGSGKTFTAARMICEIVAAGQKVGITANSHSVIRNLLDDVIKAADERGLDLQCIQKVPEKTERVHRLQFTTDNAELLASLAGRYNVAAGTAWFWARPDAFETVDVLFVDEAAQMSLANVLAVSQAAKNVVLLGDPQQLEQPMKGSHPEGTDVSALDHILGGDKTIAADRGLFLEESWRLHPDICTFTSELFYENRLHSRPGIEVQTIKSSGGICGTGLWFRPVNHEGNQNSSPEEAEVVCDIVDDILSSHTSWINRDGNEQLLTLEDILIIAPYNAQVFELKSRLPAGVAVGTVDKFQGQEAPIVIYSMTTSSHGDAPRGMEFLYSLNRLNVATSRAKCICILIACPAVFEVDCRTPRHMQLANAFCRYLELATII